MSSHFRCSFARLLLAVFVLGSVVLTSGTNAMGQDDATVELKLHPAAAPSPSLRYRLIPGFREELPGNAVVWYGKVFAEQQGVLQNEILWQNIRQWIKMPLDELRDSEAVRSAMPGDLLYRYLHDAARARSCDWQLPVRSEPYYEIRLPEVAQTRAFAWLIALKARQQIADGNFEDAIGTLQSGFGLARNLGQGETMVNALVGASQCNEMTEQLLTFVQQPGAPNLYWALAALPDPVVDFGPGLEAELAALSMSFPVFDDLDSETLDADDWNRELRTFWETTTHRFDSQTRSLPPLESLVSKGYPLAKQRLIEAGMDPNTVEEMPVARVVLTQSFRQYQHDLQSQAKWVFADYPQTKQRWDEEQKKQLDVGEVLPLMELYGAKFSSYATARARMRFSIALLQTIEAIRLHAASNGGQLPDALDQITEVPIPKDPITGQPFAYTKEGDQAVIDAPHLIAKPNRFQITLAN